MKRWLLVSLTLGLSACGSIKVRDVDAVEVGKVKRVAIASFSLVQPASGVASGEMAIGKESEDAGQCIRDINKVLGKKMGWTMLPPEQMRENLVYKVAFDNKMKGWQTGKVPEQGKLLLAPGVLDAQSLRRMRSVERDQLMDALKVDALLETNVHIAFASKGVAVMGIGSRYPQAFVSLWMYKRGVEKPVWFDGRMEGEASAQSVGKTAFFDDEEVTRLGRASAVSAFDKVNLKPEQRQ